MLGILTPALERIRMLRAVIDVAVNRLPVKAVSESSCGVGGFRALIIIAQNIFNRRAGRPSQIGETVPSGIK